MYRLDPKPKRRAIPATIALVLSALAASAGQLRYDDEYPAVAYSATTPTDRVAALKRGIERGDVKLHFDDASGRGYLASLLEHLDIPVSSQVLVYSKTSFQKGLISPETPRAIYFSDDAYVAWVKDGPALEISSVDPRLGAVFYTLGSGDDGAPEIERQSFTCLRCHDSYSLTGGGVPRHIMGSGVTDATGRLLSHEGWILTTDETPFERRWGGWYVTGTHGDMRHLGNIVAKPGSAAAELEPGAGANVTDLRRLVDTRPYLGEHSDIVALLVIEHQVHVQNLITRTSWDARTALAESADANLQDIIEPLVKAMLVANEAPLTDAVTGTSTFAEEFVGRGPFDGKGRTLRKLDLKTRLFRYPLSYLVYSEAFDALPEPVRHAVYDRLLEVLTGEDASGAFDHLSSEDRRAILEILEATKPELAAYRGES